MLKEDFEKSPAYKQMLFIGENYQTMEAKFIDNGHDFVCTNDNFRMEPYQWFKLLVIYFGFTTQDIIGEDKQIAFLAQARSNTIHLIYGLYQMIEEAPNCKMYDFSGTIEKIDAMIAMGKTELEAKLLISQIETNENVKVTNKSILKTNKSMTWILIVSMIIAAISAWQAMRTADNEDANNILKSQLDTKDKQIQLKDKALQLLGRQKDTLEMILLKQIGDTPPTDTHH